MRLSSAASHFDKQMLTDAYGTMTIRGQFDLFDDSRRDGAATRRRILALAPGVTMPSRRALRVDGIVWLAGNMNADYFGSEPIRRKYPVHQADGLAGVQSFGKFLSGTPDMAAYAAVEWAKAAKEIDESSDLSDVVTAIFALGEAVPLPAIMSLSGSTYLLRESHQSPAGFLSIYADEIKAPVSEIGTFTDRVYEPVSDTWAETATSVTFLRLRWQSHFHYLSQRTLGYQPGDDVLVCLKIAATPRANDLITLADGTWQVLSAQSEDDCWSIHARRVPA